MKGCHKYLDHSAIPKHKTHSQVVDSHHRCEIMQAYCIFSVGGDARLALNSAYPCPYTEPRRTGRVPRTFSYLLEGVPTRAGLPTHLGYSPVVRLTPMLGLRLKILSEHHGEEESVSNPEPPAYGNADEPLNP